VVGGSWPLSWLNACAVTGFTVLAYSFGYTVLEYCVFARGCFSITAFYHFSESFVVGALVPCTLFLWAINTPLASCYKSAKSWCRACSLMVINMIVCEVGQPLDEL
jgi:hypothetical protein